MKKLTFLSLLSMLASTSPAIAQPPASAQPAEEVNIDVPADVKLDVCVAGRLASTAVALVVIAAAAAKVEEGSGSVPPAVRSRFSEIRRATQEILDQMKKDLSATAPERGQTALANSAAGVVRLRSMLTGIAAGFTTGDPPEAKEVISSFIDSVDKLQKEVPPEEPTRGCLQS